MRISLNVLLAVACAWSSGAVQAEDFKLDTAKIEEAAGAKGMLNKDEGVFKVSYPRSDVKVNVDGTTLPPFMGLTSWAAFTPAMRPWHPASSYPDVPLICPAR